MELLENDFGTICSGNNTTIQLFNYMVKEEPIKLCNLNIIGWELNSNPNYPNGYRGYFILNKDVELPLLFWIRVNLMNEEGIENVLEFHKVETIKKADKVKKCYSFFALSKKQKEIDYEKRN